MFKLMNAEFFVWMKVQWMKKLEKIYYMSELANLLEKISGISHEKTRSVHNFCPLFHIDIVGKPLNMAIDFEYGLKRWSQPT